MGSWGKKKRNMLIYASEESDYESAEAILRHHVCQKKFHDRSFGGKKVLPKNSYLAAFANLQIKCIDT